MKPWERRALHLTTLVVAVTGFAYLWMKYFVDNLDPFAVVNHPWEPAMLQLHVLASPAFMLVFGVILNSHVIRKLGITKLPNRKSGLLSFALFGVMVASGYLLQVITSETALPALVWVHVGSGALFSVTYLVHLAISVRVTRRYAAGAPIRDVA